MDNKITFLQFIAIVCIYIAIWHALDFLYCIYISPGIPF